MASTAAQEEFHALFGTTERSRQHPEDEATASSGHSDTERSETEDLGTHTYYEKDEADAGDVAASKMRSAYYIPKLRSEANTGPKGVIADAQAFEQAKRQHRFSFARRGRNKSTSSPPAAPPADAPLPYAYRNEDYEKSSEEEDDDGFMARWRHRRLQELTNKRFSRGGSPGSAGKRVWGTLVKVDAEGYLDAIEQVPANTVVVVFIYDHQSEISLMVEDVVRELARTHNTTRFVKLHYQEAEMEVAGVPALLAYRGGDKFAGLVPVMDEIPEEEDLSARSLGAVLQRHQILL